MNTNDPRFELIRRVRDGEASASELAQLESNLRNDIDFRDSYVRYTNLDVALSAASKASQRMASTAESRSQRNVWFSWRPLSAAAAGVMFGMFFASAVYGFVAQRVNAIRAIPLAVHNPGLEDESTTLQRGVPKSVGRWGADSAAVVTAENGVQPLEGNHMMRLEPAELEQEEKHLPYRAYQVLDLRTLRSLGVSNDAELKLTASFCASKGEVASRYLIRAFALNETPEQATQDFWPKSQDDGVVSMTQRFLTPPTDQGWHTFSLKIPVPTSAQSLVFILGAEFVDDPGVEGSAHYLDDVRVSVLTSLSTFP